MFNTILGFQFSFDQVYQLVNNKLVNAQPSKSIRIHVVTTDSGYYCYYFVLPLLTIILMDVT